jgi:glyoxylase-like metal-dependent hydrolase (beta-lactamase superfamily II)
MTGGSPPVRWATAPETMSRSIRSYSTRREVLARALALAGSTLLPASLAAQASPASVSLSDRMHAVLGPDGNALCLDSVDGVVLVDGGAAAWANELLRTVGELFPAKPIRALFNTHWHEEQTGANRALGERGVEIIAHENTALWLGSEVHVRWSDRKYAALPKAARPTTTVYDPGAMTIGGRRIEYGWARDAHTDGDLFLFFPDENVLVTGGFVSNRGWPVIDWWTGGWTVGMWNGFDRLLEVANERTRIVPAVGPVMSFAELKAQQAMYLTVFERVHDMLVKAFAVDEVLAAKPTAEFDAEFGDPALFLKLAFESTFLHLRDAHDTRLRNIA